MNPSRKRILLRGAILVFWLVMVGWLLRFEAFPERFTHVLGGYKSLLGDDVLMKDSWMRILYKEKPIGYSHTMMSTHEDDPAAYYRVETELRVHMNLMGVKQRLRADMDISLDMMQQLQRFEFKMEARPAEFHVTGIRQKGEWFAVRVRSHASSRTLRLQIPDDVILDSPMLRVGLKNLEIGEEMEIKTWDPMTQSAASMVVRAVATEPLQYNGEEVEAKVLETEFLSVRTRAWVSAEGEILRQETPLGWIMERCTVDEAFDAWRHAGEEGDLLTDMAVRCPVPPRFPRTASRIKMRLSGVAFAEGELDTPRQSVEQLENGDTLLTVLAARLPDPGTERHALTNAAAYLAPTQSLQSEHPEIVRKAAELTDGLTDPLEKALAIFKFVHEEVDKQMTVSLPSALDVLRTMRGDCNEHTYLFTALARAAGLPAAIKVGLAYQEGVFYYHAWPVVHVGQWLEMDPTWGQVAVDASHIALLEGDLAQQMALVKVVGRLEIEVVEEVRETPDMTRP